MPIVTPPLGNPYPTISSVMNLARARVNDAINDIEGDLLADDAPATQTYLSAAWRWYQDQCSGVGVETFIRSVVISGIPVRATDDVADESWIGWTGCNDGAFLYKAPALPQDLINPLSIWRRQTGTLNEFQLMELAVDGLPVWLNTNVYDWREDGCYFYGETFEQDIRLRYAAYRPDLDITQPSLLVPMMRCENCLAARVGFEYANARGGTGADKLQAWADKAFADGPAKRTSRRKQRQTIKRRPYGGGGSNGYGRGWPVIR